MCGIVGVFSYGRGAEPVADEAIHLALDSMLARGPDGTGTWSSEDRKVKFGHRRLAIIDLSESGAQPMSLADDGLHITFNGEIYNYKELQEVVKSRGRQLRSDSDTEVLLHLYQLFGEAMCEMLRGMFAFAIWDDMKRGLLLARDHFGIKPLYVARQGGRIVFCSQVRAILATKLVSTSIDPAGHVGFFLWGNMPQPYTLYKEIRDLPPGHSMWVDEHGVREPKSFFDLSAEIRSLEGSGRSKTKAEAFEALRAAVLDSVRHHFVADVPVGVFLSAGRDSTTLLATGAEVMPHAPNAITLGFEEFEGTPDDEVPLAKLVADQIGSSHLLMRVVGTDFQNDFGHFMSVMDQPTVDGLNTYYVSKVTRQLGMKVALSGLGGDEVFGGYASFQQVPKLVNSLKAAKTLPWLGKGFRVISSQFMGKMTSPKYAGLLEYGGTFGGAYLLRRGLFCPWELPCILDPDLVREGWRELEPITRMETICENMMCDRSRMSSLEMQIYMQNRLLKDSDWAGMAHSVEIRVPFVDVNFVRALAPYFGTENEPGKADLAAVPKNPLPPEVLNRPKTGFSIPVREWLMGQNSEAGGERSLRGWARMIYSDLSKG